MRFGPVLLEFSIWRKRQDGPHFQRIRGFIAEANSAISVTLPPYLTRTEPGNQRQFRGVIGRGRK
jgi:hypothetical protein